MCRFLVVLCLTVATATASAQSPASTNQAQATAMDAERSVNQLAARRRALAARFQEQTDTIDRQMHQPRSWNRDRDVSASKRDAADTATQLTALDRDLRTATEKLSVARRAWLSAVDAELPTATGARADALRDMRRRLALQVPVRPPPRKIILPDLTLDPNADPEDLDQQAAAIRETEAQLSQEVAGLDALAGEHAKNAELLKHHQRANELDVRDDNQAHRVASHSTSGGGTADSLPTSAPPLTDTGRSPQTFEIDAPIVLQDVIDASTIEGMTRARSSGDPATRAAATLKTRDAVKARLEQVRQKRVLIEKRARELRPKK